MSSVSRNAACPCGSGKRYKDCCGALATSAAGAAATGLGYSDRLDAVLNRALETQRERDLPGAEALYREALQLSPKHPDALHMLGVIRMERGDNADAARLILDALDGVGWQVGSMQHNLGLALSRMLAAQSMNQPRPTVAPAKTKQVDDRSTLTVSAVLPVYNHERYVADAIRSVLTQDRPPVELIVIDDGSTDHSVDAAQQALRDADIPCRFIARENRGAAETLNEAIRLTQGDFIQPLNSDDLLAPRRLSTMLDAVADTGAELAFAAVACIDSAGAPIDEFDDARVFAFRCSQSNVAGCDSVGLSFLGSNPAISTGNLMFSRHLFDCVGGFRDLRYHHDWDFVLRALWYVEPVYVRDVLYQYRFHGHNTISEGGQARQSEVDSMMSNFLREVSSRQPSHPLAPCVENWGNTIIEQVLGSGLARLLSRATMIELYQRAISGPGSDSRPPLR